MCGQSKITAKLIHPTPWVQLGGVSQIQSHRIALHYLDVPVSQLDAQCLALSFQNNDLCMLSHNGLLHMQNGSAQRQVSAVHQEPT